MEKKNKQNKRFKPLRKLTFWACDFETWTNKSNYFKKHQDTCAYLLSCDRINVKYNWKTKHYEYMKEWGRYNKVFVNENGVVESYLNYFLSLSTIKNNFRGFGMQHQVHFFHNSSKFDIWFILKHILKNDKKYICWTFDEDVHELKDLLKENKVYYRSFFTPFMKVLFLYKKYNERIITIEIRDSLNLFRTSIKEMGKSLGLVKGDTMSILNNVEKFDNITDEAIEYCKQDTFILKRQFEESIKYFPSGTSLPFTVASWAKANFLSIIKKEKIQQKGDSAYQTLRKYLNIEKEEKEEIEDFFTDNMIYRGGLTTLNPKTHLKQLKWVLCMDKVSMYPTMMRNHKLACGTPYYFKSEKEYNDLKKKHPNGIFFIKKEYINIKAKYDTLPAYIPRDLILKENGKLYADKKYTFHTQADKVTMYDLDTTLKTFEILHFFDKVVVLEGVMFKESKELFKTYIDTYYKMKEY